MRIVNQYHKRTEYSPGELVEANKTTAEVYHWAMKTKTKNHNGEGFQPQKNTGSRERPPVCTLEHANWQ